MNSRLIRKCFDALNENGIIVIPDWIMNPDRTEPLQGAIFAIIMLVGTEAGDCFTRTEVAAMLTEAGFSNFELKMFESGPGQMTARKIIR